MRRNVLFRANLARILLVGALYFASVRLGVTLAFAEQTAVTFWPAAGLSLAAIVLWGTSVWPGIFLGALAADLQMGTPLLGAFGVAAGNTIGPLVGAFVLLRIVGEGSAFDRIREMLALVVVVFGCTLFSPTLGLLGYGSSGVVPWDAIPSLWGIWWVGDAIGGLVVAPAILVWARQSVRDLRGWAGVEFGVLVLSLVAAVIVVFSGGVQTHVGANALAYVAFPYIIWGVLRFGSHGAVTTLLVVAIIASWHTTRGHGPFSGENILESMIYLQVFVGVLTTASLLLAAAIAERTRAEAELHLQKSILQAQNEVAIDGIVIVSDDGAIRSWNHQFREIWGIPSEPDALSWSGCLAWMREQVEDPVEFQARLDDLSIRPDEPSHDEIRLRDGRVFDRYGTPVRGGDGIHYGHGWFFRDITQRRQAEEALRHSEEQLRHAQKMEAVGRLAGGIAHDFNNLLTAIQGHTQILLDTVAASDPALEDLEEIQRSSSRAASLTRQLLAFSRKQLLQPKVFDLNVTLGETGKMLRRLIGEDIELVVSLEPALRRVKADPGQLEQVVVNLVVNARDAMPDGGRLAISTGNVDVDGGGDRTPGPYVTLTVADTGVGMDEQTQQRIFEPFFTTKEPGKGTGLGLSMAYGIVTQSGGWIDVESVVGEGSTFRIYLPEAVEMPELAGLAAASEAPVHGSATILLAEDEPAVRGLARKVLQRQGYAVVEASDGIDALQQSERHAGRIDLLLTDVVMPRMGGRELAERLSKLRPELRVLFMSGYTEDDVLRQGIVEVGGAFLAKPFSPADLARRVRDVLDAPLVRLPTA